MSRALLLDEKVIALQPALIRALDGDVLGAIVLQQLAYWMPHASAKHDGYLWVYKTHAELSDETALSTDQCFRATKRLEDLGLLISCQPEGTKRTKWYRIAPDHPLLADPMSRDRDVTMSRDRDATDRESATSTISTESTQERTSGDVVRAVFDAWVEACGKTGTTKLSGDRQRAVKARLNEGYSEEDLIDAARGIVLSGWHMGGNPDKKIYNDLTLVCRNGGNVEKFRDLYRSGGEARRSSPGVASNLAAVNEVLDAYERTGIVPGSMFGMTDG